MPDKNEEKSKLKVIPVKSVKHTDYNDLIGIRGHQYYFVNTLSGKITYRKGSLRIPTSKTTIMAAKDVVAVELERMATGQIKERIKRSLIGVVNPMFKDLYTEAVAAKESGKKASTKKGYWKSWDHGLKFFWADKTAADCNDSNCERFKKAYLETYPERSFHHTGVHLGMAFRHMFKHGYIKEMPDLTIFKDMESIVRGNKKWIKPGRVYSTEEISAMFVEAEKLAETGKTSWTCSLKHKEMLASRAVLSLHLGLSGLRMQTAAAMEWEKVDFQKKIMTVWSFKNKKWYEVPMNKNVVAALKRQHNFTGRTRFVFPMPTNPEKYISNQVFEKVWFKIKKNADLKDWNVEDRCRFHDLRHTFATMTAELGWPPKVACDVLDMSLDEYDKTYAKPSGKKKSEWMNKTSWEVD